jgi:hypothetical protein
MSLFEPNEFLTFDDLKGFDVEILNDLIEVDGQPAACFTLGWRNDLDAGIWGDEISPNFLSMAALKSWMYSPEGQAHLKAELTEIFDCEVYS